MTSNQKIIERNEFGVEEGIESLAILEALALSEGTPEGRQDMAALQYAIQALEDARQALADCYDTLGRTAKARRRENNRSNVQVMADHDGN